MSLLRHAIKSNVSLQSIKPTHALPFFLRESPRHFSTGTEQSPPPGNGSSVDPFLQKPRSGLIYGRFSSSAPMKNMLKVDLLNLLEGCGLTLDDIKVDYSAYYTPLGMLVQFSSQAAYANALRSLGKRGRFYRLDKIDRAEWDMVKSYNGRTVILQGIPLNATTDDVERVFPGCEFDSSSIQLLQRSNTKTALRSNTKTALIRFATPTQAMNAFITKNRGFCLNNQISLRVLQ